MAGRWRYHLIAAFLFNNRLRHSCPKLDPSVIVLQILILSGIRIHSRCNNYVLGFFFFNYRLMVNGVVAAATTTPFLSHGIRMQAAAEKLQIII